MTEGREAGCGGNRKSDSVPTEAGEGGSAVGEARRKKLN